MQVRTRWRKYRDHKTRQGRPRIRREIAILEVRTDECDGGERGEKTPPEDGGEGMVVVAVEEPRGMEKGRCPTIAKVRKIQSVAVSFVEFLFFIIIISAFLLHFAEGFPHVV